MESEVKSVNKLHAIKELKYMLGLYHDFSSSQRKKYSTIIKLCISAS